MTDKRFGSWSLARRQAHVKRMTEWFEARRKAGAVPGPTVRLRELRERVMEISGRMALANSTSLTGWAAELREAAGFKEATPFQHDKDCKLDRALRGRVECEHGYDVCPKCDPCSCQRKPPEAYPPEVFLNGRRI